MGEERATPRLGLGGSGSWPKYATRLQKGLAIPGETGVSYYFLQVSCRNKIPREARAAPLGFFVLTIDA
jgi:hypothetical protein